MNRRHKTVLALSLAIAGFELLDGAKISAALGINLVGASLAWLIGSQFVLASAMCVWKHRIWSAIIAILGVGAVYGWIRYDAYRAEKRKAAEEAEMAAYRAKMKPFWDCESRNSQFSNADTECEKDPSVTLQLLGQHGDGSVPMSFPDGSRAWVPKAKVSDAMHDGGKLLHLPQNAPSSSHSPSHHVKTLRDTELTTTEWGTLTCGRIRSGEAAVLLIDDGLQVKIKTADGQIGWASGSDFEVIGK